MHISQIRMKAAIIRITDDYIDFDRTDILEQIQDIFDDPNTFELVDIDVDDPENINAMILKIVMNSVPQKMLESDNEVGDNLKYNVGVTAMGIHETKNHLYACYFLSIGDLLKTDQLTKEDHDNVNLNRFGSQLTSSDVASDLVIVKHNLSYSVDGHNIKTDMQMDNVLEYTLVRDMVSLFKHRGIIVEADGKRREYHYIQNPIENIIMAESDYEDHYRYHEYEVFNHQITIFVDNRENRDDVNINSIATKLSGHKTYGRVMISLSKMPDFDEMPSFAELTDERFDYIEFLRSRSTELTKSIAKSDKAYVNFDKILEVAKSRYSDRPIKPIEAYSDLLDVPTNDCE
jgi:hypothetical protein